MIVHFIMSEIKILGLNSSGYTSSDRSYCMELSMNVWDFSNIFYFKPTSTIGINEEEILFYVEPDNWPDISFSEGIVSGNAKDIPIHLQDVSYNVKEFGPNLLAYNISKTTKKSVEIFDNNDDLIEQYVILDNSVDPSGMKQLIKSKLINAGTVDNPLTGLNTTITNITRDIILHFLNNDDPNVIFRLDEMINGTQGDWKPIIFNKGDILQFDIIYDAQIFAWQKYQVDDQDYVVKIYLN